MIEKYQHVNEKVRTYRQNKTLNTLRKSSIFVSIGVQWSGFGTFEKYNDKIVTGHEKFQRFEIINTLLQKGLQIL